MWIFRRTLGSKGLFPSPSIRNVLPCETSFFFLSSAFLHGRLPRSILCLHRADLARISKHVLGILAFLDPWQYLAADANQEGQVTTYDIGNKIGGCELFGRPGGVELFNCFQKVSIQVAHNGSIGNILDPSFFLMTDLHDILAAHLSKPLKYCLQ